jgi:putative ABC transport system ATP-binding protein
MTAPTLATTHPVSTTEPVVRAHELAKRYGEGDAAVDALRGVDVAFTPGTFTAIMGPSGSGKSTLMHLLAGLDRPTAGWVEIDGTRLDQLSDRQLTLLRRRRVGFIFQSYNLLPVLDARENIELPLRIGDVSPERGWLDTLIDAVGLRDRLGHRPSELSGGQQQRVAVARALVSRPAVIFADEPTGNLDSTSSREVLALLRRAVDDFGQTIVMVTHDPAAAAVADRLLFLADGSIVRDAGPMKVDGILDLLKELR